MSVQVTGRVTNEGVQVNTSAIEGLLRDSGATVAQFRQLLYESLVKISTIKPSEWVEQNVIMQDPFPGPLRYSLTPYTREWIDNLAEDHPMLIQAIMKGAQIGASASFIIAGLLWTIAVSPCRTYFTVGTPDLVNKAVEKLDIGITNANIRHMIMPQVQRNKKQTTGDTNNKKDFLGGYINICSANNEKNWRDVSLKRGFHDDWDAVKKISKTDGNIRKLVEKRYSAFANSHKISYISSPTDILTSNIWEVYQLGDERGFNLECPHCHKGIVLDWEHKTGGGIVYRLDNHNKLVPGSVEYQCPLCANHFKEKIKYKMLPGGVWVPTKERSQPGYYSYQINCLYTPPGMYNWDKYVYEYLDACPPAGVRDEMLYRSFRNLVMGLPYEAPTTSLDAKNLMKNTMPYEPFTIPESLSEKMGHGKIVLVTMAMDLNGIMKGIAGAEVDDVRLDWEIAAWSEDGSRYSIAHGSIGTFVPLEKNRNKENDRQRWTCEYGKSYCVWDEAEKLIDKAIPLDNNKGSMRVLITGVDTGRFSQHVYSFLDKMKLKNKNVVGVRGEREEAYFRSDMNKKYVNQGTQRKDVYYLKVGYIKDIVSEKMAKKWDKTTGEVQPPGFMSYPTPMNGMYGYENFYEHYEAEQRVAEADGSTIWKKKNSAVQNHMFDLAVYNEALVEIEVREVEKVVKNNKLYNMNKEVKFTYSDYVSVILQQ